MLFLSREFLQGPELFRPEICVARNKSSQKNISGKNS